MQRCGRGGVIAPEERPGAETARVSPHPPGRCSVCQANRRRARKRREILVCVLLAAAFVTGMVTLFVVGSGGDILLGWFGIFVAFGLVFFADQCERG